MGGKLGTATVNYFEILLFSIATIIQTLSYQELFCSIADSTTSSSTISATTNSVAAPWRTLLGIASLEQCRQD
jgi:hypothetical protein